MAAEGRQRIQQTRGQNLRSSTLSRENDGSLATCMTSGMDTPTTTRTRKTRAVRSPADTAGAVGPRTGGRARSGRGRASPDTLLNAADSSGDGPRAEQGRLKKKSEEDDRAMCQLPKHSGARAPGDRVEQAPTHARLNKCCPSPTRSAMAMAEAIS
jgi:hypothetical protein